jgi:hypothetical protein
MAFVHTVALCSLEAELVNLVFSSVTRTVIGSVGFFFNGFVVVQGFGLAETLVGVLLLLLPIIAYYLAGVGAKDHL